MLLFLLLCFMALCLGMMKFLKSKQDKLFACFLFAIAWSLYMLKERDEYQSLVEASYLSMEEEFVMFSNVNRK